MIHVQALVLLALSFAGSARRGVLIGSYHNDAKVRTNTLTKALEVSMEALLPLHGAYGRRPQWRTPHAQPLVRVGGLGVSQHLLEFRRNRINSSHQISPLFDKDGLRAWHPEAAPYWHAASVQEGRLPEIQKHKLMRKADGAANRRGLVAASLNLRAHSASDTAEASALVGPEPSTQSQEVGADLHVHNRSEADLAANAGICDCASIATHLLNAWLGLPTAQPVPEAPVRSRRRIFATAFQAAAIALASPVYAERTLNDSSINTALGHKMRDKSMSTLDPKRLNELLRRKTASKLGADSNHMKEILKSCPEQESSVTPMLKKICEDVNASEPVEVTSDNKPIADPDTLPRLGDWNKFPEQSDAA